MRPHPRSKKRYWRDKRRHEGRDLNGKYWLIKAIFDLFPLTSWKNEIPMFGGPFTNTGIIWSNMTHEVFPGSGDAILGGSEAAGYTLTQDIRMGVMPVEGQGKIIQLYYHGKDPMDQGPYPPPNPTVRVVDAKNGLQYYPNILTNKTPNAHRMRLIDNGINLTDWYHINFYDTATGEMHYIEKGGPVPGLAHWKVGIFKNVKIIMRP